MTDVLPFDAALRRRRHAAAAPGFGQVSFLHDLMAEELRERLIRRAQDSASVVAKRMAEASSEISHWPEYDYVIVNQDLDVANAEIEAILRAERLKRRRRVGLSDFVRGLTKGL